MALHGQTLRFGTREPSVARSHLLAERAAHYRNLRATMQLFLCVSLYGSLAACSAGTQQAAPRSDPGAVATPDDQLSMRDPDRFRAPSSALSAGGMQRTGTSLRKVRPNRERPESRALLTPIRLAPLPRPQAYPLRNGELVLPSGLVVHRVPKGISVRSAREQQTGDVVLEIADPRGRRLALLSERAFRRAAAANIPVLEQTATTTLEAHRSDWGEKSVRVIVDRFRAEHHIYTLERRARGTRWIMSNLELGSRPREQRARRAE